MADSLCWKGYAVHCDDIVARGENVGVVVDCLQFVGCTDLFIHVEIMQRVDHTHYVQTASRELWPIVGVRPLLAWRARTDGSDERQSFDVISR